MIHKIKKFFKQLFCCHIFKDTHNDFLRSIKRLNPTSICPIEYYVYAVTEKCINCGKKNHNRS